MRSTESVVVVVVVVAAVVAATAAALHFTSIDYVRSLSFFHSNTHFAALGIRNHEQKFTKTHIYVFVYSVAGLVLKVWWKLIAWLTRVWY